MPVFKSKAQTYIDVGSDEMHVSIDFTEKKEEFEGEEFTIPKALYVLTPAEAKELAKYLLEEADKCHLPIPSTWEEN